MLKPLNRILLALAGLVLLVFGGAVLATGLGASLPSWWFYDGQGAVLLSDGARTRWRDEGFWWPVVFAVLAVLVILLLWWLLAQARRRRLREVLVDSGDGEGALLRGPAMESVLASDAEAAEGVARARVALTGRRSEPRARIRLLLEAHAEPADTLHHIGAETVARARDSAGLAELPAEVRMRAVRHRAERVN
ncbi:alkaline shock response membrane anchor protein AmaP [Streptomyces triticagri]|uniref:Alkaline shock response membrane anchor protein AmaP n=1 Tax=Streptomyces triticagri TaxID=2293568 RepID=A0A372MBY8_9ACTN|nr:alkaline shock response membrane anchor protein AmaP [Streptomyces triticagri]RFU88462.1 alkaline shock response membrane anchor protein AmaP [Streptomyces triticagri]